MNLKKNELKILPFSPILPIQNDQQEQIVHFVHNSFFGVQIVVIAKFNY